LRSVLLVWGKNGSFEAVRLYGNRVIQFGDANIHHSDFPDSLGRREYIFLDNADNAQKPTVEIASSLGL
ncbi:hypothetical protein KC853_03305, partial [Candidatus Saccharibacteria bacterium]|nr:hypothetical protein [Candidatus Saccharibacteria bacterium]